MKDSCVDWIGEIPEGWNVVPFRSYVKERAEKNKGEKTRELLALSFALGVTLYKDKVFNMDRVKENYEDYQLVYENDLVLSPNDIIKGSVYVSKYYGCISPMYLVFSARDKDTYHLPYLSYLLRTSAAGRKFFFIARGLIGGILDNGKYVTRRMTVSRQDLLSFKVLLPPLPTQQRIADFLDRKCDEIDKLAALQETMIAELKRYKQSLITETVTKGLDPNAKMKDSGVEWIGEIPEEWKKGRVKNLCSIISKGATPPTIDNEAYNGSVRFIKCENISNNKLVNNSHYYISSESNSLMKRSQLQENDILFVIAGTIGKTAIVPFDALPANTNQAVSFLRLHNTNNVNYLWYVLQSQVIQKPLWINAVQSAQPNLSMEDLGNFCIPLPFDDEQQQIADYLDRKCAEIDELIAIKQQKVEALKEYKKSVIFEYVTGKKEVL